MKKVVPSSSPRDQDKINCACSCVQVQTLYVRNVHVNATENDLAALFSFSGQFEVERVKKFRDYAFVRFPSHQVAELAFDRVAGALLSWLKEFPIDCLCRPHADDQTFGHTLVNFGDKLEVHWAKPMDPKRKRYQQNLAFMSGRGSPARGLARMSAALTANQVPPMSGSPRATLLTVASSMSRTVHNYAHGDHFGIQSPMPQRVAHRTNYCPQSPVYYSAMPSAHVGTQYARWYPSPWSPVGAISGPWRKSN